MTSSTKPVIALWLWLPAMVFALLIALMATDRPVDTQLAVIDLDQTASSRHLLRQLDASQRLAVTRVAHTSQIERRLATGDLAGILTIPKGYEQGLSNGQPLAISAKLNMVNYLQANQIHSQLLQQTITDAVRQQAKQFLSHGSEKQQAAVWAHPVQINWQRHNNPQLSYRQALLPGFLLQAWNLCFSLQVVWLLAQPWQATGTQPTRQQAVHRACTTTTLALISYVAWFWLIQLAMSWLVGLPLSWPALLAAGLNLLAMQGIAMLMLGITRSRRLSLNGMSVVAATALAFMGVSFPFDSMPLAAQLWANLLPITSVYRVWQGYPQPAFAILLCQAIGWLSAGSILWFSQLRRQKWAE